MPPIDIRGPLARRWQLAALLAGMALLLSLIEVGQATCARQSAGRQSSARGARIALPFWTALAALTPLPVWLARRWPLGSGAAANLARHAAAAAVFALTHAARPPP